MKKMKNNFLKYTKQSVLFLFFLLTYYFLSTHQFIKPLNTQEISIAKIEKKEGQIKVKNAKDTIWMNLEQEIKNGDYIQIDKKSNLTIRLKIKNKDDELIDFTENTFFQLFKINDQFFLDLKSGDAPDNLDQLIAKKILISTSTDSPAQEIPVQKTAPEETTLSENAKAIEPDNSNQPSTENPVDPVAREQSPTKSTQLKVYPADKSILIYKKSKFIDFSLNKECPDHCEVYLKSSATGKVESYSFKTSEPVQIRWSIAQMSKSEITWKYQSTSEKLSGSFQIILQSDQSILEVMKSNRSFEIID